MSATLPFKPLWKVLGEVAGQRYYLIMNYKLWIMKNLIEYVGKHKFRDNLPFTRWFVRRWGVYSLRGWEVYSLRRWVQGSTAPSIPRRVEELQWGVDTIICCRLKVWSDKAMIYFCKSLINSSNRITRISGKGLSAKIRKWASSLTI